MSKPSKIFSVILIILLITAFTTPAASAAPEEEHETGAVQFLSIPVALIISSFSISVTGHSVVDIGHIIGIVWNGVHETWDKFVLDVANVINNLHQSQKIVDVKSKEGRTIIATIDAIVAAAGGSPKKDDKVYVEAKKSEDGKSIEIRTKLMNENEALKEMRNGKHIMTKNETLSKKIVERYYKDYKIKPPENYLKPENHHENIDGYYYHLHYGQTKEQHLHCWMWEKPPKKP